MADFEEAPVSALQQVFGTVTVAGCCRFGHMEGLKKVVAYNYINKQWINKRSVGPERLSVRDNPSFALTV